jgi:CheY-like chemotaxis protein
VSAASTHAVVLLVEDDDDIREAIDDALTRRGFTTMAVAGGHEALAYLRGAAVMPRVILLDLTMPRMSGWEFMQVQADDPALAAIPVVALSAIGNLEAQPLASRWAGILTKPVSVESLTAMVARFCTASDPARV